MSEDETSDDVDRFRAQWRAELPDLDTSPMATIGRINRFAKRVSEPISETFERFGVDRGEFDVLATLRRSGPPYSLTPTELYRLLMLSSGGVTHRLKRLEARGLIVRERSGEDARSTAARLTEAGSDLVERAFREDMAREAELLQPLDASERETLAELLRRLLLGVSQ